MDELDLWGIGRLLALTSNDEVNSLAALHFSDVFGRAEVYRLSPKGEQSSRTKMASHLLRGRLLFARPTTFDDLHARFAAGGSLRRTKLTEAFTFDSFRTRYGDDALLLFVVGATGQVTICSAAEAVAPKAGDTVVALVSRNEES